MAVINGSLINRSALDKHDWRVVMGVGVMMREVVNVYCYEMIGLVRIFHEGEHPLKSLSYLQGTNRYC
jgi:hypothetical protein